MSDIIVPVPLETWAEHFTNRGWSTIQDQIDAGYPLFLQPSASTAVFEDIVDLGVLVTRSTTISVVAPTTALDGSVELTWTLGVSEDGVNFTDYADTTSVLASGFQYVKVRIDAVGADDTSLIRIGGIRLRIAVQKQRDGGRGIANSADVGGTEVIFNTAFLDVESLTVTAKYNANYPKGITALYDFTDTPNPTSFFVYLFDADTGGRVSGEFSWAAEGS